MTTAVLNAGPGAWAFEPLAVRLSQVLGWPLSDTPARCNYVLGWDGPAIERSFIPLRAIHLASDKRRLAEVFALLDVPTPETLLIGSVEELREVLAERWDEEWVVKWPTGCGASGHRLAAFGDADAVDYLNDEWPRPFVLQKFIRLERPEVFRLYAVAGETFGWNVRRFPEGSPASPFVAHARGARYEDAGEIPPQAEAVGRAALEATGLLGSFGCADLMRDAQGRWLALEVNTDGVFQHVDRDLPPHLGREIEARLARAVNTWAASTCSV